MATSGAFTYQPEIADLLRESFERATIKSSDITWDRIESGLRSANFTLNYLAQKGWKAYEMTLVSQSLTAGDADFTLSTGARIFTASLRRDGIDTPMVPVSREDYEAIPDKDNTGRPFSYFLDPATYGTTPRTVTLWPVPENSTDVMRLWVIRRPEAITQIAQDAPISFEWQDAFCAELAARLAEKYVPAVYKDKRAIADAACQLAREADRDRSPLRMRVSARGRRGWR